MYPDKERMRQNLLAWADITALCVELRKSVFKARYGIEDDDELTRMVFADAVKMKEKKWEAWTRSQNTSKTF